MDLFQGGLGELPPVQHGPAPGVPLDQDAGGGNCHGDQGHGPPFFNHKVRDGDHALGNAGQVRAQVPEGRGKGGDGLHHDDDEDDDGNHNDHNGIGQGAGNLCLGLGGFVKIGIEPAEAQLQGAGLLTGPDGLDKGDRQGRAVVFEAGGQRIASGHILGNLIEDVPQLLVGSLLGNHLHAADNGQAGGEDDGELGADHGQVLVLDLHLAQIPVQALGFLDLLNGGDDGAGAPQLGHGLVFIIGLDDAGDLLAVRGQALVFECGHFWNSPQ